MDEPNVSAPRSWQLWAWFIGTFLIHILLMKGFRPIKMALDEYTRHGLSSYVTTYVIGVLPVLLGSIKLAFPDSAIRFIGLRQSIWRALALAALFTLPMFAGALLFFQPAVGLKWENVVAATLVAGFMEELVYRGFLFGVLYYRLGQGFVRSVGISAMLFALGHIGQGRGWMESLAVLLVTFSGGAYFAWLYVEWKRNLWVPVFMHALMNLAWMLFDMDQTAAGGWKANVLRALSIALAIGWTLAVKRRRKEALEIRGKQIW